MQRHEACWEKCQGFYSMQLKINKINTAEKYDVHPAGADQTGQTCDLTLTHHDRLDSEASKKPLEDFWDLQQRFDSLSCTDSSCSSESSWGRTWRMFLHLNISNVCLHRFNGFVFKAWSHKNQDYKFHLKHRNTTLFSCRVWRSQHDVMVEKLGAAAGFRTTTGWTLREHICRSSSTFSSLKSSRWSKRRIRFSLAVLNPVVKRSSS